MGDRPIRDRTLVLRVLVPGLESRLRDKMEETAAAKEGENKKGGGGSSNNNRDNSGGNKESLLELDGVTCEPTNLQGNTLWNFHCDGAKYPARLVNLPCPVELHKTHDHAMYYKCTDLAQMLIVYEDSTALAEAEDDVTKHEAYPSYHPDGLTYPLRKVVERRFAQREHSGTAPPRQEVSDVEEQLVDLMERISKEGGGSGTTNKRSKVPSLTSAALANKTLEEVTEEILDYEPWMDDNGREPGGVSFNADDPLCQKHPEVWIDPEEIQEIREQEAEEAERKKQKAADKKAKKNKKAKAKQERAEEKASTPSVKKGIASKKNVEDVDEVTQIAQSMIVGDDFDDFLGGDDDNALDFDFSGDDMADMAF